MPRQEERLVATPAEVAGDDRREGCPWRARRVALGGRPRWRRRRRRRRGTSRSLSPLPMTRTKPPVERDVVAVEPERLADAQPGRVEQLEEGTVAEADEVGAAGRLEELPDLRHVERVGQALRLARQVDEPGDVGADQLLGVAEAVEGTDRGSLASQARGSQHTRAAGPWPPGSREPAPGRSPSGRCRAHAGRRGAGRWRRRGSWPWPGHARRADSRCRRR